MIGIVVVIAVFTLAALLGAWAMHRSMRRTGGCCCNYAADLFGQGPPDRKDSCAGIEDHPPRDPR